MVVFAIFVQRNLVDLRFFIHFICKRKVIRDFIVLNKETGKSFLYLNQLCRNAVFHSKVIINVNTKLVINNNIIVCITIKMFEFFYFFLSVKNKCGESDGFEHSQGKVVVLRV